MVIKSTSEPPLKIFDLNFVVYGSEMRSNYLGGFFGNSVQTRVNEHRAAAMTDDARKQLKKLNNVCGCCT